MSTMVDSKLAKSVQKSVGRAKEKILQNLGKVDRTADEIFDDHVANFNKQQCAATRLQKELNNYIRCIRACATASRALLEAVSEVYEPEWGGKELVNINSQTSEMLWNDFAHRLAEQVLIPLNTYQGQFPEMRKKIEKRGRKLVDYDGERHALQALQSNPRRAEAKLARQRENLEAAKRTYEVLNSELHEELPSLYGSRIAFLVSAMNTLFAAENIFHSDSSKVYGELEGIVERLLKESAKGTLAYKAPSNAILNNSDSPKEDGKNGEKPSSAATQPVPNHNNASKESSPSASDTAKDSANQNATSGMDDHMYVNVGNHVSMDESDKAPKVNGHVSPSKMNGVNHIDEEDEKKGEEKSSESKLSRDRIDDDEHDQEVKGLPVVMNGDHKAQEPLDSKPADTENDNANHAESATTPASEASDDKTPSGPPVEHGAPNGKVDTESTTAVSSNTKSNNSNSNSTNPEKGVSGVLYRVRATYRYQKEDVDELSFEAGEIINVVEFEDPEEQEEGWLMGIKENGEKGLFPANFTRQL